MLRGSGKRLFWFLHAYAYAYAYKKLKIITKSEICIAFLLRLFISCGCKVLGLWTSCDYLGGGWMPAPPPSLCFYSLFLTAPFVFRSCSCIRWQSLMRINCYGNITSSMRSNHFLMKMRVFHYCLDVKWKMLPKYSCIRWQSLMRINCYGNITSSMRSNHFLMKMRVFHYCLDVKWKMLPKRGKMFNYIIFYNSENSSIKHSQFPHFLDKFKCLVNPRWRRVG